MIPKNFVNKIKISITVNLIKSLKAKDSCLSDNDVFTKVFNILRLDKIIASNFDDIEWCLINDRFQGIIVEQSGHLVCFARALPSDGKTDGRNTYISQPFKTACKFSRENGLFISVSISPLDVGKRPKLSDFILLFLRTLLTLNIRINESLYIGELKPFNSLNEYYYLRIKSRNKKSSNRSTYLEISDSLVSIFGKLDGANFSDTFLFCEVVLRLAPSAFKIIFLDITKYKNNNFKENRKIEEIASLGIFVNVEKEWTKNVRTFIHEKSEQISTSILQRNQILFKKNILKNYSNEPSIDLDKCFCCDYNVPSNLIAAHINRVADIREDFKKNHLSEEEAIESLVSGDNGFLLCPNHDREFEKGYIYFDLCTSSFQVNKKQEIYRSYDCIVKALTRKNCLVKITFSNEFVKNVHKHISRTMQIDNN